MAKVFKKKTSAKRWAKKTPGTQQITKTKKGYKAKTVKRRTRRR